MDKTAPASLDSPGGIGCRSLPRCRVDYRGAHGRLDSGVFILSAMNCCIGVSTGTFGYIYCCIGVALAADDWRSECINCYIGAATKTEKGDLHSVPHARIVTWAHGYIRMVGEAICKYDSQSTSNADFFDDVPRNASIPIVDRLGSIHAWRVGKT